MVGAAPFQYLNNQKSVRIFGISMRNLEYQSNKTKKPVTNPVFIVLEGYYKFLDVFSKKKSNKVFLHFKYNYKVKLVNRSKDYG